MCALEGYEGNKDIRNIVLEEGLTEIPEYAFKGCSSLREVVMPSTLRRIGRGAFEGCDRLYEAILPEGLEEIGSFAFKGCIRLHLDEIPSSVKTIGDGVFWGCESIREFIINGRSDHYSTKGGALYEKDVNRLVAWPCGCQNPTAFLRESTLGMQDYAFSGNHSLSRIIIPTSLEDFNPSALIDCPKMESVFARRNDCYREERGALYADLPNTLVYYPPMNRITEAILDGVEEIGPRAMAGCNRIVSLILPKTVARIAGDAFEGMERLRSISLEKGFSAKLPMDLYDAKGNIVEASDAGGHTYRKNSENQFVSIGEFDFDQVERDVDEGLPDFIRRLEKGSTFEPVKVTGVTFEDIAGHDEVKAEIHQRLILPYLHPNLFRKFRLSMGGGVLMYGVPGTGKTMLAQAVACELDAAFFSVKPSDIMNKYVGEDEKNIRELFQAARKEEKAVIFLDDFDALGKKRGNEREPWCDRMVTELLTQMQGLEIHEGNLLVLAATNRPWDLDSALMRSGRFAVHIKVPLPDRKAREYMFRRKLEGIPRRSIDYAKLAEMTEGYNGADIEEVCERAKLNRVLDITRGSKRENLGMKDFEFALEMVHSTVCQSDLEDIDRFEKTGKGPAARNNEEQQYVPSECRLNSAFYN